MTKEVEELEHVIIRFAGDSGDGMQLTGSRFTDATAVVGNDLATLPSFPAEIRAPAGTTAGVSAFQIHFASRDILTPGDHPNVLVAMNPAALKANQSELPRGATIIVNEDAFTKRNLEKAGYEANPLEDGSLQRVPRAPPPDEHADHARRGGDGGRLHPRCRAGQEPVRARRRLVAVRAPHRRHPAVDGEEVRPQPGRRPGQPGRVQRRLVVRRDHRAARRPVPRPGGHRRSARHVPQRQRHHGALAGADRRQRPRKAPAGAGQLSDHARLRAAARALAPRQHRGLHDPGRGRDRRRRDGAGRLLRRPAGRDRDQRPGHGPQGRDDRPGGDAGAADDHHRRAARRPVDGHADQDRAVRPADGALRPPRRVAAAGDRPEHGGRVLRRRVRGGAHRHPLPDAGDPALRQLPGLLLGAVAGARRRLAARDRPGLRHRSGTERFPPIRAGTAAF